MLSADNEARLRHELEEKGCSSFLFSQGRHRGVSLQLPHAGINTRGSWSSIRLATLKAGMPLVSRWTC
jgi:hypothetical protein